MPVIRCAYQDTLRMRFDFGEDEEGNRVQRTRSYTRVKHIAPDEALFDLADGFAKLFAPERVNVYRVMHVELSRNEG